ncbi:MAG TPA: Do family serine endopeptidase [Pirellulaceae bacterium]|nr:Do family serine endopeptidase [Pirellulaceae bacterium]
MENVRVSKWWKPAAWGCLVLCGLAAAGYWASGPGSLIAQSDSPAASEAQERAIGQANALSEAFRAASDRVVRSVVSIQHEIKPKMVRRDVRPRGDSRLPKEFEDLDPLLKRFFEDMPGMDEFDMPSMPQQSAGSGVIIDKSGVILTNNHVVAGGGKITVKLHDGREYEATDVQTDPNTDIAVIKIKAEDSLPTAALGDSDKMQVGDWVLALGQPFGLQDTLTAGIVSAKQRAVGITKHAEFIQTDAAINPGNSGGPLVNLRGEVIGINTAISSSSGGFQGIGFAVPVNVAKWASSQLLKDGKVHRAYMGVGIQPVTKDLADQLGLKTPGGAIVTEVFPGSPADQAGIKPQDVIVGFGGQAVQSSGQIYALAGRAPIGSKQPVVVMRDGKRMELSITLKEQPANFGVASREREEAPAAESEGKSFDNLGLEVAPLTADVARQLGMRETKGVVITAVERGSPADVAGLTESMAIMQVGRKPVHSADEFHAALKDASLEKGVLLLVRTAEGSRYVVIRQSGE